MENLSGIIITLGLVVFNVIFSFTSFGKEERINKYSFMPYQIRHHREGYRFLSHAFIHADEMHLIFNMIGLYMFGSNLEAYFTAVFTPIGGKLLFLAFYTSAIYAASVPQFLKEKDNRYFSSIGASGAVNAVVFANIIVDPTMKLGLIFIPIPMPAWVFGLIYLGISYLLSRRKTNNPNIDRIDHSAHFWGAAYGIIFMCSVQPALVPEFFRQITGS